LPPPKSPVLWLDGVVVPPLWRCTRAVLEAHGVRADPGLCFALIDLGRELGAGAISGEEYCRRVIARAALPLSSEQLAAAIESRIEPAPGMVNLLDEISPTWRCYLLADYPPRWLLAALSAGGLARHFPEDRIVITAHITSADQPAAALEMLAALRLSPEESLLIDGDPLRAMALFRAGLSVTTFVDALRLRREFVLWSMLPSEGLRLRPAPQDHSA